MIKPNTLIVGSPKTGTTSLRIYLNRHPEIYMHNKELHYFTTSNYEKGTRWYKKHFNDVCTCVVGEKSPSYFYFYPEVVPKRVFDFNPDMKLLFTLRNPVSRAWSHHLMHMFNGYVEKTLGKRMSFGDMIRHEQQHGFLDYNLQYLSAGDYCKHIMKWMDVFPKSQMYFLVLETLDQKELDKVCCFLDVKPFDFGELKHYNRGGMSRSPMLSRMIQGLPSWFKYKPSLLRGLNLQQGVYPDIKEEDEVFLYEYYKTFNSCLEELLDIKLDCWRNE